MVNGDGYSSSPSLIKEVGKDTLYCIPAKVVPALVGFVSIIIYTRLLDPAEYGLCVLATTVISAVYAFCSNWMGYVVWRYFENYKNDDNLSVFLSTVFTVLVLVFTVTALVWYAVTISL